MVTLQMELERALSKLSGRSEKWDTHSINGDSVWRFRRARWLCRFLFSPGFDHKTRNYSTRCTMYEIVHRSPFTVHGFAVCGWQSNSFSSSSSRLRQAYGAASCPRTCCPAQRFGVRGFSRLERERRPVRRAIVRTTNEKLFAIWSRMGVSSGQLYALTHFSMNVVSEIDTARTRMSRPSSLRFGAPSIQHWARRRASPRRFVRHSPAAAGRRLKALRSRELVPTDNYLSNSRRWRLSSPRPRIETAPIRWIRLPKLTTYAPQDLSFPSVLFAWAVLKRDRNIERPGRWTNRRVDWCSVN
jgi:hypothetical protein